MSVSVFAKPVLGAWMVCLLISCAVAGDAAMSPEARTPAAYPGKLARLPDGRRLNFRCSGQGAPTILLESGYGGDSLAWFKIQPTLATRCRVCAYDRAGAGFSDPGPTPRDGAAIARDLDQGLRAARIGGPFVIVGHSSGGLYARVFADLRPKEVVGMVLVDPSIAYQDRRFSERFGAGAGSVQPLIDRASGCLEAARAGALPSDNPALKACVPTAGPDARVNAIRTAQALQPGKWTDQISELRTLFTATADEVDHGRASYGAMPLIVLTADGDHAGAPPQLRAALDAFWSGAHQEIAARSSRGREETVAHTSHMMIFDRPDATIAAVDEVVRDARKAGVGGESSPE